MNRSQLSKIVRYLFVEKKYGIKSISKHEIWLLKEGVEYPIICVILKQRKQRQYYDEKLKEYQTLLQSNQQGLIVNANNLHLDVEYEHNLENTFISELFLREDYHSILPDSMINFLTKKLQPHYFNFAWITLLITCIALTLMYFQIQLNPTSDFLIGGYFSYAIIEWQEFYRIFTMPFYNRDLLILIISVFVLSQMEKRYLLEYNRKIFSIVLLFLTSLSTLLALMLKITLIEHGVLLMSTGLVVIALFRLGYLMLVFKQFRRINYQISLLLKVIILAIVYVISPNIFMIALLAGMMMSMFVLSINHFKMMVNTLLALLLFYGISLNVIFKQLLPPLQIDVRKQLENHRLPFYEKQIQELIKQYGK